MLTTFRSAFEQALLTDTNHGDPWIRRVTFAAQAPDLPDADERRRFRDDGLTHRSAPALYPVPVRSLAALTGERSGWRHEQPRRLRTSLAGFLPTVRYLSAVALVSYLIHAVQWMYHQSARPPFSYRGLAPHKTHAMPGVPKAVNRSTHSRGN